MTPTRSFVLHALRMATLALSLLVATAHADEYTDVSQLLRAGQLADALAKADQFLGSKPKDPQMRFLKGVIQRDANKTTEAIATFSSLIEEFPELPEPYNNLAVLYAALNQYDKARTALEMAVRTNPSFSVAHENLGDVYAKLASQEYASALQLDKSNQTIAPKLALVRELLAVSTASAKKSAAPAPK
ncbi:MAG: tetratricopeptide repeat protein [Rhodoferax sp.]